MIRTFLISLLAVSGLALVVRAEERNMTLPPETGTYQSAPGVELVQANCIMCHSTEYVATQPPKPRAFWEAIVKKMKAKFGAPLKDEQIPSMVDYLTAAYGVAE